MLHTLSYKRDVLSTVITIHYSSSGKLMDVENSFSQKFLAFQLSLYSPCLLAVIYITCLLAVIKCHHE